MIVLCNNNINKMLKYLEEKHFRKQKVFIRIMEGYDSLQGPDGEMGFGVFDVANHTIYVAGDVPEPELGIPNTIAHEYCHYLQWCDNKTFNEDEAELFAVKAMEESGLVDKFRGVM